METFKGFVNDSEYLVKKSTAFCMLIPGFKSLCGDDRLSLLKSVSIFISLIALSAEIGITIKESQLCISVLRDHNTR